MDKEEALNRVWEEASKVFGDPDEWMSTVNKHLDRKTPKEAVEQGEEQKVLALLEMLADGVIT